MKTGDSVKRENRRPKAQGREIRKRNPAPSDFSYDDRDFAPPAKRGLKAENYGAELINKQKYIEGLLGEFGRVEKIIGMENPFNYRNKVHHAFAYDKRQGIISGSYLEGTHKVINDSGNPIEDDISQKIIRTIRSLCGSFKITAYNEDTGFGLLRHVLVRRGFATGEIMVALVLSSQILPGKNNFIKALRTEYPEITTVVINVNNKKTSMVLGDFEKPIYGPGYIKDRLCGCTFRISPKSFYQVNPVQCEKLYGKAMEYADIKKTDTVIDAYCGIGTIGICAASKAGQVIGVELNPDAVRDAVTNARESGISNIRFVKADATEWINSYDEKADVVILDPPRTGSTDSFISAVAKLGPSRVVYVSCDPDTLQRDLRAFERKGYKVKKIQPVDMFPFTEHVETVCLLSRNK